MAPPSRFQTLPMLIVEMVVEYLEERTRTSLDGAIDRHNSRKTVLTPLLWVSERWREAALNSICDNCSLFFSNTPKGYEVVYPAWPDNFLLPHFDRDKLVKRIVVLAPSWDKICSGAFSKAIVGPIYKRAMFPTATSLMVFLSEDDDSRPIRGARGKRPSVNSASRDQAAANFARSLLKLAPKVTGVSMYFCTAGVVSQPNRDLCNVLVSELCKGGVSRVEMDSAPGCSLPSFQLPGVSGLTGLIQGLGQVCAPFARIAYLNASTLKELVIRPATNVEWLTMIYGDSKVPVVYTSLTSLVLQLDIASRSVKWAKDKDVAPFPALAQLSIYGVYPFEDDLIYRGNGGSLKALRVPFDIVSRNILGSYNVFKRSGVTRMNVIELEAVTDVDNMLVAGQRSAIIRQQIDCMLEITKRLRLINDTPDMHLYRAIKTAPHTAALEHLTFYELAFDTDNIIEIISVLPSLVGLYCKLKRYFTNAKALPVNKQPSVLHEKHYPLSSNFRELVIITDEDDASTKQIAVVAMQLAVLCPKFTFVD
ncbi:hypothetical protein IWW57_004445, partial [Coemansia sp. S610]